MCVGARILSLPASYEKLLSASELFSLVNNVRFFCYLLPPRLAAIYST